MSKNKIFLFTSDIAAFIGQNSYDFVTPFERLWKRCDKESYNQIINVNKRCLLDNAVEIGNLEGQRTGLKDDLDSGKITKRQYTLRLNKLTKQISDLRAKNETLECKIDNIDLTQEQRLQKGLGEENIQMVKSDKIETDNKRQTIVDAISKLQVSDDKKRVLLQESQSFINKTHGTLKEDSAIAIYEKRFNVTLDTSQEFFKKRLDNITNSNFDWYVGGRVDGLYVDQNDPKNSYIIEVKNRTRGFFSSLRDYEKTQIHLYMWMLDIPIAKLVEKYNDQIRITLIHQNDDYLNDILAYLSVFANGFENRFLKDTTLKTRFVESEQREKQQIVKRLYLNEIEKLINQRLTSELADDLDDDTCLINDDL